VHRLTASELLARYRSRELSPREALDALAGRIEQLNPSLGAFTTLCLDRAREEATGAERAYLRGEPAGPLAGVPFAAKDLFDSEGVRTTYGSRMFAAHVPERDAAAVAGLRRAGAVLVGKTQTHEFAWGITSVNEAMGSSRNPWDTTRVPGGSSGGSAVALAAGLVPLALGSDTGGSVRIPAAFCGVLGFKPTFARLDASGLWPLAPSLDHVGLMARDPGDLALASGVLGGDPHDAGGSAATLDGATVVTCPDLHAGAPAAAVESTLADALATVEALGARIEERGFPLADRIDGTFRVVQGREAIRVHEEAGLHPSRAADYGADVRRRLEAAAALDEEAHAGAVAEREAIRTALIALLGGGALLLTPVSAVPPPPAADVGALRSAVLPYTTPQNLAGLPSCAVRAGFDDLGLPIGVQLTAGPGRDAAVLAAARAFTAATAELQSRWPEDRPLRGGAQRVPR
jgi:aspartyl-tRNA(Asn)/glutamyl-tRNA(Gln) amidotransferase subunit A